MKSYVGLKERCKPEIFETEIEPSRETHPEFDVIYGPFKSRADAERYVQAMVKGVACGEG